MVVNKNSKYSVFSKKYLGKSVKGKFKIDFYELSPNRVPVEREPL